MALGPGKLFGTCFTIVAVIVAVSIAGRIQVSMRMQRVNGTLDDDSSGSKAISYTIGHVGTSKGNTVNVKVRYRYMVEGKEYQGHLMSLNGNFFGTYTEDRVKQIIADLSAAPQIPVWYDPKHPDFAVLLEPKIRGEWGWLISLVLLALLSFKYLDTVVIKLQGLNRATR